MGVEGSGLTAGGGRERFLAGDPIRGVAAVLVVVYHTAFLAQPPQGESLADLGLVYGAAAGDALRALDLTVFVFLVLSGYLIGRPFVHSFVAGRPMPPVGAYVRNRVLRIVPTFWVVFGVVVLLHGLSNYPAGDVLSVFAFAQNYHPSEVAVLIGPGWTVDVEVTFYLALPLVALVLIGLGRTRGTPGARRAVLLGLLAMVYLASLMAKDFDPPGGTLTLITVGFGFMPGIALAALETTPWARTLALRAARNWSLGLVAVAVVVLVPYAISGDPGHYPPRPETAARVMASVFACAVVAAPLVLQWGGGGCPSAVDNRVTRWLGARSYPIYLVHQGILLEFVGWSVLSERAWPHLALVLAIAMPLVLAAGALLHVAVERPALRRRRDWRAAHELRGRLGRGRAAPRIGD
ncbi:MAG TPA: acyltransferase [Thermoleophilaceae bacterium]|jgi:peptidoglycan/LPS O-acetylase OafA/YrhL